MKKITLIVTLLCILPSTMLKCTNKVQNQELYQKISANLNTTCLEGTLYYIGIYKETHEHLRGNDERTSAGFLAPVIIDGKYQECEK